MPRPSLLWDIFLTMQMSSYEQGNAKPSQRLQRYFNITVALKKKHKNR